MQMGLPVVAARLPILEQLFDDRSIRFFTPGNIEDFTAKVLELWASPELRRALTACADQGFVCRHSWQHEQTKYFALVNDLLGC
jgi:glycosyltransferase involved in cell wall biosynthesis